MDDTVNAQNFTKSTTDREKEYVAGIGDSSAKIKCSQVHSPIFENIWYVRIVWVRNGDTNTILDGGIGRDDMFL